MYFKTGRQTDIRSDGYLYNKHADLHTERLFFFFLLILLILILFHRFKYPSSLSFPLHLSPLPPCALRHPPCRSTRNRRERPPTRSPPIRTRPSQLVPPSRSSAAADRIIPALSRRSASRPPLISDRGTQLRPTTPKGSTDGPVDSRPTGHQLTVPASSY